MAEASDQQVSDSAGVKVKPTAVQQVTNAAAASESPDHASPRGNQQIRVDVVQDHHNHKQQQECGAEEQRVQQQQQQQQQEDPRAPATAAGRAAVNDHPLALTGQPGPAAAGGDSAHQAAPGDQDLTAAAQAASALALQQPEQHGLSLHPGQQHPYSLPGGPPNHQAQLDGASLQRQLLMQQQQQQRRPPRVMLDEFNPDLLPKGVQRDLALLQERRRVAEQTQTELGYDSFNADSNVATMVQRILKSGVLTHKSVEYRKRSKGMSPSDYNKGTVTAAGLIRCSCHNTDITMSEFETHSNSQIHRPAEYIFIRSLDISLKNFALLVMTKPLECSLWYCAACSEGGELLCCDGCPAAYHTKCLGSNQQEPSPHSEWLCGDCRAAGKTPRWSPHGPQRRMAPLPGAAAPNGPSPAPRRANSASGPLLAGAGGSSAGVRGGLAANRSSSSDLMQLQGHMHSMGGHLAPAHSGGYGMNGMRGMNGAGGYPYPLEDPAALAAAAVGVGGGGYGSMQYAGAMSPPATAAAGSGYAQQGAWAGYGGGGPGPLQQHLPPLPPQQRQQQHQHQPHVQQGLVDMYMGDDPQGYVQAYPQQQYGQAEHLVQQQTSQQGGVIKKEPPSAHGAQQQHQQHQPRRQAGSVEAALARFLDAAKSTPAGNTLRQQRQQQAGSSPFATMAGAGTGAGAGAGDGDSGGSSASADALALLDMLASLPDPSLLHNCSDAVLQQIQDVLAAAGLMDQQQHNLAAAAAGTPPLADMPGGLLRPAASTPAATAAAAAAGGSDKPHSSSAERDLRRLMGALAGSTGNRPSLGDFSAAAGGGGPGVGQAGSNAAQQQQQLLLRHAHRDASPGASSGGKELSAAQSLLSLLESQQHQQQQQPDWTALAAAAVAAVAARTGVEGPPGPGGPQQGDVPVGAAAAAAELLSALAPAGRQPVSTSALLNRILELGGQLNAPAAAAAAAAAPSTNNAQPPPPAASAGGEGDAADPSALLMRTATAALAVLGEGGQPSSQQQQQALSELRQHVSAFSAAASSRGAGPQTDDGHGNRREQPQQQSLPAVAAAAAAGGGGGAGSAEGPDVSAKGRSGADQQQVGHSSKRSRTAAGEDRDAAGIAKDSRAGAAAAAVSGNRQPPAKRDKRQHGSAEAAAATSQQQQQQQQDPSEQARKEAVAAALRQATMMVNAVLQATSVSEARQVVAAGGASLLSALSNLL